MFRYALRRLALAVPTLVGITVVNFGIIHLAPGDPGQLRAGEVQDPKQSERIVREIRRRFHLDRPIPVQYALWVRDLVRLDLGNSIADERPVVAKVRDAFWPTVMVNVIRSADASTRITCPPRAVPPISTSAASNPVTGSEKMTLNAIGKANVSY